MLDSICGIDCIECSMNSTCGGCVKSGGKPFGGACMVAECCSGKGAESCKSCGGACSLRAELAEEFNSLGIADMPKVTRLNALQGYFINMEYVLPGGQAASFWQNNRIYLGNQLTKKDSDRCYGIAADERYLMVCEYGESGTDAEIVIFKRRK